MNPSDHPSMRFSMHGLGVIVRDRLRAVAPSLERALGEFAVPALPDGQNAIEGALRPYDKTEVLRHLSPTALKLPESRDAIELYQDNERFWLIDDRWGLAEVNMLKGQWRSWIISEPVVDAGKLIEQAVMWPIAQLLRGKGLHLLPAAAVARGEAGLLIISPLCIEAELTALLRAGYRMLGQNWCALREHDGKIAMLHMPGRIQRHANSRAHATASGSPDGTVDLEAEYCGSGIEQAACSAVLLIEAGRRPTPGIRPIAPSSALPALRRAWPIAQLHPTRLAGQLPARLSRLCKVHTVRLSPHPEDLLDLLAIADQQEQAQRSDRAARKQVLKLLEYRTSPHRNVAV